MVLYRARWRVELLFKPRKSHDLLAGPPAGAATPERAMAEVWAERIAVMARHWLLLTAAWPDARRSLGEAARVIRDRAVLLIEALADPGRLIEAPGRIGVGLAAAARITPREAHPGSFQLLANPELLDWGP